MSTESKDSADRLFCVKYINKTRCVALIYAKGYEDVPGRFKDEGYKGQITSVQFAK